MTKFFDATVKIQRTQTLTVQVAAETQEEAIALAKKQAELREPGFAAVNVEMTLVGECNLIAGSRVIHRIFGGGVVERIEPGGKEFRIQVVFDSGATKWIAGPGSHLRPEGLASAGQ